MKFLRSIIYFLLLATFTIANAASTEAYTIDNVPNVRLQDKRQYTSDPANLLSQQARDSINIYLATLEHDTNIESAVVMLPSIGEADAFEFGHSLFRQWGIGKRQSNNGLLILYVEDQHTIRFVTGYGIEGSLTDALCKRIQQQFMVPYFKEGKRDLGMVMGVKAVCKTLKGEKFDSETSDDEDIVPMIIFMCTVLAIFFVLVYFTAVRKRRCPQCGKRAMKAQSTDHYRKGGRYFKKVVYVCENCGKVDVRTEEEHGDDGTGDAIIAGSVLGSMFGSRGIGGSFSGGGFSGGSFGGGSSGGGGAGSSW